MEFSTTFWSDFTIADAFGIEAINDTYNRAFNEWKDNVTFLTELVIILNNKCWWHYEHHNQLYCDLYRKLYYKADDYAKTHLKGDDISYYFRMTD